MSSRAIIYITPKGKESIRINYSRRMYAIIRRYTPEALESGKNECFAELTGLRTFFKMSYQEIVAKIVLDLEKEIGISFRIKIADAKKFDSVRSTSKKSGSISTYKEISTFLQGNVFSRSSSQSLPKRVKRVKLTVPFLGKVK